MNLYVYYDDRYMASWLSDEISIDIKDYMNHKGFRVVNAEQLEETMKKSVDEGTCWKDLIVFSRDVVPETIYHWQYPNTLIRNYLDSGGTIIWLGDIPLYYQGLCPSSSSQFRERLKQASQPDCEKIMKNLGRDEKDRFSICYFMRGSFNVLGVVSLLTKHSAPKVCSITEVGRELGLRSSWYSERPILIRGSNLRKSKPVSLATSKPQYMMPFERSIVDEKKEKRFSLSVIDLVSKILGLIPALVAMATALYLLAAGFATALISSFLGASALFLLVYFVYWFFWSRATYAGAWFRNFDRKHPYSGFYRLWDFRPYRITKNSLEELHSVCMTVVHRLSKCAEQDS